jgi:hypothetical protein
VPKPPNRLNHSLIARAAQRSFAVVAATEVAVGLAVLAFPGAVMGLLLNSTLTGVGLVVTRLLGIAIIALGLTWWFAKIDLRLQFKRVAPGFISYNMGVGLLFLLYSLTATRPVPLSWVVSLVHLLVGLAFGVAAVRWHKLERPNDGVPSIAA